MHRGKCFYLYRNILYIFSWKLVLIYVILWPSVGVMKTLVLLFSFSVFCNYLLRKDIDCSFPGQQQKPYANPTKEEVGRPCAGIYLPLYHQFDAPVHSSLSVPKEEIS